MQYWLVKTEASTYSWTDLLRDKKTSWTGVRNFQARNNLRAMRPGDKVLVYHSGDQKSIVGIAEVERDAHIDPTSTDPQWVTVDLVPIRTLPQPIDLYTIKQTRVLKKMKLVTQGRLSVMPVTAEEFRTVISLG